MKKIGIFGGTFNPPHIGHKRLAGHFLNELKLDRLLVIPTFQPPHKQSTDLAGSEDRLNMCRLAFPGLEVSDLEIKRGGRSYTVETLRELRRQNPCDELFLIIGSDMLLYFEKWHRCDEILSLCTVCAADRQEKNSALREQGVPEIFKGRALILSDLVPFEVSSTQIRELIRNNQATRGLLEPAVREYIDERGLYRVD